MASGGAVRRGRGPPRFGVKPFGAQGKNMGRTSMGIAKREIFCREPSKLWVERQFCGIARQRWMRRKSRGPIIRGRFGVEFARMKTYLDGLARDFRYALRNLRQNRRFSLIAIFALALGIGASTVVFSVVNNLFFHALPYKYFARSGVVEIRNRSNAGESKGTDHFSPAEFRAFREQNHVFEDMIAHGFAGRLFY